MRRPIKKYVAGTQYIGTWKNTNIPIYDVLSYDGLNSIIGYAKHLNNDEMVLYRGQCELYDSLLPSIRRNPSQADDERTSLDEVIEKLYKDVALNKSMAWNDEVKGWEVLMKTTYEAALQHYGVKTDCLDFVDNHWTALWFALNRYDRDTGKYVKRKGTADTNINMMYVDEDPMYWYDLSKNKKPETKQQGMNYKKKIQTVEAEKKEYNARNKKKQAYLLLYLAETSVPEVRGLYLGKDRYTVDLRKALPGVFLRPVAQHGWVVKAKKSDYDHTKHLLCILRLTVDLVDDFLGNGALLQEDNFFPSPETDLGYRLFLTRQKRSKYEKTKLKNLLPEGFI